MGSLRVVLRRGLRVAAALQGGGGGCVLACVCSRASRLGVDVLGMVREEVLLEVLCDQDHLEVRGVGQLDHLLCSSGGSCRVHPPKTRTTR